MLTRVVVGGAKKYVSQVGRYLCQVCRYVCKSSFTPLFLHTTTGLRHNFYTEHCFFFSFFGYH